MIELDFDPVMNNCVACGNADIKQKFTDFRNVKISSCNVCGLQFMNPQYSDKYLTKYYSIYTGSENNTDWNEALLYGHDFYFSLIEKYARIGTLLDVGCGSGHLLEAGAIRGWIGRGYDVDETLTQNTAKRLSVDVASGDFMNSELGGNYDLVTMHQVLEHVKNPAEYIKKIHLLVKEDGCLFIAVPNIKSLANRFKYCLEKIGVRRKNKGKYYDSGHHIVYFEPDTLKLLLERNSFKVVYQRNGHSVRPKQSGLVRFIMRNISDKLFYKSTFLIIAKKV